MRMSGPLHRRATYWVACASVFAVPAAFAQTAAPAEKGFFLWTDTSLTALPYGWGFEVDPAEQSTLTFEHAHASSIGDLFMFVDFTKFHHGDGNNDETWYGEFAPRLSFGKLFGKDLSHTFFKRSLFEFKDVLFAATYERGEDPDIAEALLVGVGFDLDVREAGLLGGLGKFNYVQLNIYGRSELIPGVEHGFEDIQITLVASYPFAIGKVAWTLDGYFDWVLGLGSEGWNYHLNPQLTADLGKLWGLEANKFAAGIELDFWWNKYQIPDSPSFDTNQAAISLMAKYHF